MGSNGKIILSDFTDEGFELLEKVHNSEGRSHNAFVSKVGLPDIEDYFRRRSFSIEKKNGRFHKIIVVYNSIC